MNRKQLIVALTEEEYNRVMALKLKGIDRIDIFHKGLEVVKAEENKSPLKTSMGDEYYERLIHRLAEIKSVTDDATKTILEKEEMESLMQKMPNRERYVLEMRWGLISGKTHTFAEVGKMLGVSRERVRQIEEKAFNRLRNFIKEPGEEKEKTSLRSSTINHKLSISLTELGFQQRTLNCFKGTGIETLGALISKSEEELLGYPNFGKKSLTDIKTTLSEMGLNLGMQLDQE